MRNDDQKKHAIRLLENIVEIIILAMFYYVAWKQYTPIVGYWRFFFRGKYLLLAVYAVIAYLVFRACDSFNIGNGKGFDVALSQAIAILITNFVTYFQLCLVANGMLPVAPMIILTIADCVFAFLWVLVFTKIYHRTYVIRDMVMVYGNHKDVFLKEKFDTRRDKYRINEMISEDADLDEIFALLREHTAVILNDVTVAKRNKILKFCYENRIRTYMVPRITDVLIRGAENLTLFDTPLTLVDGSGLTFEESLLKRICDIFLACIAIIICAVPMLIISLAIKIEDGGKVFYKQKRLTLNDKVFDILKFRSMIENAEELTGAVLAEENDPRITKVGSFLRKHRLDELPQIFNVLSGNMSLVGPRPERPEIAEQIEKEMPEFKFRTKVKGGVTGYAQVYGKYNTTSYDKLKMDLIYIENYSFILDIKLVLMTPQILFRKDLTDGVQR